MTLEKQCLVCICVNGHTIIVMLVKKTKTFCSVNWWLSAVVWFNMDDIYWLTSSCFGVPTCMHSSCCQLSRCSGCSSTKAECTLNKAHSQWIDNCMDVVSALLWSLKITPIRTFSVPLKKNENNKWNRISIEQSSICMWFLVSCKEHIESCTGEKYTYFVLNLFVPPSPFPCPFFKVNK